MVDVDAPAAAPAPAKRDSVQLVLTGVIAALALISVVPWERWCSDGGNGFSVVCFDAPIWGGSAWLFGLLALIASVGFVAQAVILRRPRPTRLSAMAVSTAAIALVAVAAKLTVVLADAAAYSREESGPGPVFAGTWLGLCLVILGAFVLLMVIARHPLRWAPILWSLVAAAVLIGLAIPYARSGLAWWGGPLAAPGFLGGGNGAGYGGTPGRAIYFDSLLYVNNPGYATATFDGLDAVGRSPGLVFSPTYVLTGCGGGAVNASNFDSCTDPVAGYKLDPGGPGHSVALGAILRAPAPGLFRVSWFRIRYRVGPFHFEVFRTDQLSVCASASGKVECASR